MERKRRDQEENITTIRVDRDLHDEIGKMRNLDESYADAIRRMMRGNGGQR